VRAPAAAVVVEQRALADAVVQPLEESQQRIGGRDAAIEIVAASGGAQVVVEQRLRWAGAPRASAPRAAAVERWGDRGGRGGLITRSARAGSRRSTRCSNRYP
jgi:hypothetical protein